MATNCACTIFLFLASGCASLPLPKPKAAPLVPPPANAITMCDGAPRSSRVPINYIRLRQDPPPFYVIGPDDVLGIYIECVVPNTDEPPMIHFPNPGSPLPPAFGYPFPVRGDGTIALPFVPPIQVAGLTLAQAEREIRIAYTVTRKVLNPNRDRIIVSLLKPRTYQVMVIREDTLEAQSMRIANFQLGAERRGLSQIIDLPAYENDVLHALIATGGLPGVEAKAQVVVLRGAFHEAVGRNGVILDAPNYHQMAKDLINNRAPNIVRIPLRVDPCLPPPIIHEGDILLGNGDIVYIQSREAEVFYTGGLLVGGQFPLPRDYDLDILGAIAMSGGSVASAVGGSGPHGMLRGSVGTIFPPTRARVIRFRDGCQYNYVIDLREAFEDPSRRILIEPNDVIVLEYKGHQVFANVCLNMLFFNFSGACW